MYIPRPKEHRGRRNSRIVMLVAAIIWTGVALLVGWEALDEARGGTVDAEVVAVKFDSPGRRVYDVRFEALGRSCESRIDSGSEPRPRDVHVGGRSRLTYSASDPCGKVRETGIGPILVFFAPLAAVMWAGVWFYRPREVAARGRGPAPVT
ncbi:hypothetical protein [Dactylosporangium salmoneum]|uniref:DUF3592 domain-containing protein n=1 Tax=Dactylosporangium salmoneum TaxID=53361 RepID=A0ABN3FLA9_9ACTN